MAKNLTIDKIRAVIREELDSYFTDKIQPTLDRLEDQVESLKTLRTTVDDLKESVEFSSKRVDDLYQVSLPAMASHIEKVANALTLRILDMDVHKRKWQLTVHGLKGNANEDEDETRTKCVTLARDKLKIRDADPSDFAACHRLKRDANSGVILRFRDLRQRDRWLANAKNLKGSDHASVSISPDLPPVLRPLRKDLLNQRRLMSDEEKTECSVRHLRSWPYVEMHRGEGPPIKPTATLSDLTKNVLGIPALLTITEPTD